MSTKYAPDRITDVPSRSGLWCWSSCPNPISPAPMLQCSGWPVSSTSGNPLLLRSHVSSLGTRSCHRKKPEAISAAAGTSRTLCKGALERARSGRQVGERVI